MTAVAFLISAVAGGAAVYIEYFSDSQRFPGSLWMAAAAAGLCGVILTTHPDNFKD